MGVADLVVFIFDGRAGFSDADQEALALIRETGCPLIVAVNKIDEPRKETAALDFYAIGAQRLFLISAAHGGGVADLLEEIVARLPAPQAAVPAAGPDLRLALIGRPNVGKSSLLNRLSGFERAIVDSTPGTTRDPVDARLSAEGRDVLLIDTAGIRRPPRVEGELEHHSVGRAIETIRRAEVLLLVIDATEGITDQDARLARLVDTNDRALVLVCNKWDAAAKEGRKIAAFVRDAHERFPFLAYASIVFTSALTGDGVRDIIPAAIKAGDSWRATFQTSMLNRMLAARDGRDGSAAGRAAAAQPDVRDAGRRARHRGSGFSPTSSATFRRTTSAFWRRVFARRWVWLELRCASNFAGPGAPSSRRGASARPTGILAPGGASDTVESDVGAGFTADRALGILIAQGNSP